MRPTRRPRTAGAAGRTGYATIRAVAVAEPITDPDDPRLADYRALTDVELRTRFEPPHGLFIAEGELVLRRALRAGYRPRSVLVDAKRVDQLADSTIGDAPVYAADQDAAASRSPASTCTAGVLASFHRRPLPPAAEVLAARPARGHPRGRQQPHQRRRDLPGRGRAGHGRRAAVAVLRRPALPPQRPGQHGRGVRGAVRPAGAVAGRAGDRAGGRVQPARADAGAGRGADPGAAGRAAAAAGPRCWAPRGPGCRRPRWPRPTPGWSSRCAAASTRSTSRRRPPSRSGSCAADVTLIWRRLPFAQRHERIICPVRATPRRYTARRQITVRLTRPRPLTGDRRGREFFRKQLRLLSDRTVK